MASMRVPRDVTVLEEVAENAKFVVPTGIVLDQNLNSRGMTRGGMSASEPNMAKILVRAGTISGSGNCRRFTVRTPILRAMYVESC